jgi:hypothetical protein
MKSPSYPEHFERLWNSFDPEYGEKGSKKRAYKAFLALAVEPEDVDYIIGRYRQQLDAKRAQRLDGEFCSPFQHVERYLRNGRFDDEISYRTTKLSKSDQRKASSVERFLGRNLGRGVVESGSNESTMGGGRLLNLKILDGGVK